MAQEHSSNPNAWHVYFVLNGLLDGQDGERALTCGVGKQQPDGWYYMLTGMDDGIGPFTSVDHANAAAQGACSKTVLGYTFTPGEEMDWAGYAGAEPGSLIAYPQSKVDGLNCLILSPTGVIVACYADREEEWTRTLVNYG